MPGIALVWKSLVWGTGWLIYFSWPPWLLWKLIATRATVLRFQEARNYAGLGSGPSLANQPGPRALLGEPTLLGTVHPQLIEQTWG